ncbi:MAG: UbiA family prenyltransferase [Chitinispirillaceae bacterium]|nr:UbiA family prenyltransferase [Chitinispirillaceae bacterium]
MEILDKKSAGKSEGINFVMSKILQKILDCLFLLRIPLLAPVWTIFILGWITGSKEIVIGGSFISNLNRDSLRTLWIVLIGFSLIVASIYVVNQIVDIESDRINRKLFLLPHGFVSVKTAWILATICAFTGFFISFYFNFIIIVLFSLSFILGVLYNLPPLSLKNRALGGVIANALGHGMLTFLTGWYCAKYPEPMSLELFKNGIISSIAPALANGAVFLATTIPDMKGDMLTGKKTFCVKYGKKITARTAALLCAATCISVCLMEHHFWVMGIPSIISLFFFIFFAITLDEKVAFKAFKWPVFLLTISVSLYVPQYGLLILITFFGSKLYYNWRFGIDYPTFKAK